MLLDRKKSEINYINGKPENISNDALQDKSNRYYFSMLKDFNSPTILVSKIDLNIEKGKIQIPYKPMIRISLPVFDKNGAFNGAVILNYFAEHLFSQLKSRFIKNINKVFVLNSDGYILIGPNPSQQWGFMFNGGKNNTFNKLYKSDWFKIQNKYGEVYQSDTGVYLKRKINISDFVNMSSHREIFSDYNIHCMGKSLQVIILGETRHNPILCSNPLHGVFCI